MKAITFFSDCEQDLQLEEVDSEETAERSRGATEDVDEQNYTQLLPSQPPPYSSQQQQHSANHSSTNDTTTSRSRNNRQNQLTCQARSGAIDQHLIREPPPPYPGLPVNPNPSHFVPMTIGASSPNSVMNTAPFPPMNFEQSPLVYVLSPSGQVSGIIPLLPGQLQHSAVAQPRNSEGRGSQLFPPMVSLVEKIDFGV